MELLQGGGDESTTVAALSFIAVLSPNTRQRISDKKSVILQMGNLPKKDFAVEMYNILNEEYLPWILYVSILKNFRRI